MKLNFDWLVQNNRWVYSLQRYTRFGRRFDYQGAVLGHHENVVALGLNLFEVGQLLVLNLIGFGLR
ncbi:hypothetical protein D3C85_1647450 [compost metagenome]